MKRSYLFLLLAALAAPLSASASDRMFVLVPALIDPDASISVAVRTQCKIDEKLGNSVIAGVKRRYPTVTAIATAAEAGAEPFVQMTIIEVHGYGGGTWSGPKSMNVKAELMKGGTKLASKVFHRSSRGVMTFGTCGILENVTVALGKDVSTWLVTGAGVKADEPAAVEPAQVETPPAK